MDGYQFEEQCAIILKRKHFSKIEVTKSSGDQGVDIIAYKHRKKYGIQCKYYTYPVGNKAVQEAYAGADRVLCDVPCSGIGVLRHKPEVKEKSPEALAELPALQLAILENGARYVKAGGILQYSTCTILKEENEGVAEAFLQAHPEFEPVPVYPALGGVLEQPMATILPEMFGSDGFFVAKFRKKG